ncbi:FAD-dependent monooxygenase [Mycobacterium sp.]|uniref:FAD-dependent monooxygenase n=1 Tax=Mycobacterium sp. TaxID=1785 RepID=UPI003D14077A
MREINVPVFVVGGGGCGLSFSIFLSNLGVEHLVCERREGTSRKPKAHYLNQRTMEIFRQHGIADSLRAASAPIDKMGRVQWMTSLGGDGPLDRRVFHTMEAFGGGSLRTRYEEDSPVLSGNLPQIRLEPLLRRCAADRAPSSVLFNHLVTKVSQDADGVTALVENNDNGEVFRVNAQYLVGADAGRLVGPTFGIDVQGPTGLLEMVGVHFSADLSQWWNDDILLTFFTNPEGVGDLLGSGAMAVLGPTWGKHSEEWVIQFAFGANDPARKNDRAMVPRVRELLKLPDLELEVHGINHWVLEGILADKYQVGRAFIAGDAAHRHPPTTGLGLNTAFGDAHNLAWKLALVLNQGVSPALLDTYGPERRETGRENVDWAMFTFMNHGVLDAGLGLTPGAPLEQSKAAFETLFSDSPMGEWVRARAEQVFRTHHVETQAHDREIGYSYRSGALVPDGTEPPPRDPVGLVYTPTTRPGHRLPHAWIESAERGRVSTHDLTPVEPSFVLITGDDGSPWREVAERVGKGLGVTVIPVSIGERGDYTDPSGKWQAVREIGDGGAILVRPDNHIGWRAMSAVADPGVELTTALAHVLGAHT